ncbi:MAG: cupin domain-containing protein [Elusimicrobiales bacterium]
MKNITIEELIKLYAMKPHPEGGFYRETYRSQATANGRNICTAIYFLLPAGAKSRLHRLGSDEIWHFYLGGPLTVAQIFPDGREERVALGPEPRAGQVQQHAVPAGCWFGAYPAPGTKYALVGCTVAPGFDFDDFEIGGSAALLKDFPASAELIKKLA